MKKISFVATVLNEEKSIDGFLQSIFNQSERIDDIIIVDGGSTDNTISAISNFQFPISNTKARIKLIFKKGNRSVGRNEAIKRASNEIILCSDAGCILDKYWARNITAHFKDPEIDVVAGYYRGNSKTAFEKCLIPYVLVMPDKVRVNDFLPASRSMAFKKSIWEKAGKFPEKYSDNEDYVFAKRLKNINAKIIFEEKAIVDWIPRGNIKDAFMMFYRFAKGDSESGIFRPKVFLIFLRYIIVLALSFLFYISKSNLLLSILCLVFVAYVSWSIVKNFKYVKLFAAVYYLPLIQVSSDLAIMLGTIRGLIPF